MPRRAAQRNHARRDTIRYTPHTRDGTEPSPVSTTHTYVSRSHTSRRSRRAHSTFGRFDAPERAGLSARDALLRACHAHSLGSGGPQATACTHARAASQPRICAHTRTRKRWGARPRTHLRSGPLSEALPGARRPSTCPHPRPLPASLPACRSMAATRCPTTPRGPAALWASGHKARARVYLRVLLPSRRRRRRRHCTTQPRRHRAAPWPSQTTRDARTHVCLHACVLACASTHRRSRVAAMCAAARACVVVRARARASRPPPPPPLPPSPCSLPPRAILPKEAARVTLGVRHNTHAPVCTALRRQSRGARAGLRPIRPRRPAAVRSGRSGRRRPSRRRAAPPT